MAPKPSAAGRLKRSTVNTYKLIVAYYAALAGVLDDVWHSPQGFAVRHFLGIGRRDRAQVGTVIQVGVIGLAIILIILVYGQVQDALPDPGNADLSSASTNATSTFADAMELAPVIMIVLLAAVVIAVVQRFRS